MNGKLIELAVRRATLVERAATQRVQLSQALAPWRGSLEVADQGLAAVRYIRSHPALLVGVVAFLAAARPGLLPRWLGCGWRVWRMTLGLNRSLPGF
jgi:hypothetical protein